MAILGFSKSESKRYTLMIEDAYTLKSKEGVIVAGNLHGEIKVGDVAYFYHHTKPVLELKVKEIEIGKHQYADSATNQRVTLLLDGVSKREDMPKYAVLTNIKAQYEVGEAIENPMMLGLSMEYVNCARDEQYLNTLIYAASHSYFITPVKVEGENVSFTGVTSPEMPGVRILPLFTDNKTFTINEAVLEDKGRRDTMVLRFPDVVAVVKNGYSGAVINPYGPVPVFLPMSLIEHITSLAGYKKEFGE